MNYALFPNLLAALYLIHFKDKSITEVFANDQELLKRDNSSSPKPRISSTEANTFTPTTTPKTSFNRTEEIQAENSTSEPMQDINATSKNEIQNISPANVTHLTDIHERTQISQSPNAAVGQAVSEHEILTLITNTTSSVKLNVTSDPTCLTRSSTSETAPSKTNGWYTTSNQSAGSTDDNSSTPSYGESVTNTLMQTTTTSAATSQGLSTILTPAPQSETPAGARPSETAKSAASPISTSASSTAEPSTGGNQTYGSTTTQHTTPRNSASGSITTGVTTQTAGSVDRVAITTPTQSGPLTTDIHASTTALTSKPTYTPSYTSEGTTLQSLATASTNVSPTSVTRQATKEEGSSIDQFTQEITKSAGSVTTTSVTPTQAIQPIAQSTMTQNTSLETLQSTPEGTTDGTPSQRTEGSANKNVNSSFTPSSSPVTRVLSANIPEIVTFSSLPSTVVVLQSTAAIDSSSQLPSPLSTEQSSPNSVQANTPGPQFNSTSFPSSRANIIFFKYTPKIATLTPLVFDYPIVNRINFPAPNDSNPQEQSQNNTNQAGST